MNIHRRRCQHWPECRINSVARLRQRWNDDTDSLAWIFEKPGAYPLRRTHDLFVERARIGDDRIHCGFTYWQLELGQLDRTASLAKSVDQQFLRRCRLVKPEQHNCTRE